MKIPALAGLACLAALLTACVVQPYPSEPTLPPDSDPGTYQTADQASEPPPALPDYDQPPCPEEGWVWTPGVWRFGPSGYFWVPGTWVAPPRPGVYWTPGYWGVSGAVYVFHPGYWGPHVGYYGGINYGGGYAGNGFVGGRWNGPRYEYNTAVTNVNVVNVHNTYNQTVVNNVVVRNPTVTRTSYVGTPGARMVPPSRTETTFAREPRTLPTPWQMQHHDEALASPPQHAVQNQGRPPVAATPRPAAFTAREVTAAKPTGPVYRPQARPEGHPQKPDNSGKRPQ